MKSKSRNQSVCLDLRLTTAQYSVSCLTRLTHDPPISSSLIHRSSKYLKLLVICKDDGNICGANKMGLACITHESIQT